MLIYQPGEIKAFSILAYFLHECTYVFVFMRVIVCMYVFVYECMCLCACMCLNVSIYGVEHRVMDNTLV